MRSVYVLAIFIAGVLFAKAASGKAGMRVVAADGSGEFRTVQAAVDSIPAENRERIVVYIKNATYREQVHIANSFITLRGENRNKTEIVAEVDTSACDVGANESKEEHCATVFADGSDLVFQDVTIKNSFDGSAGGKAAALAIVNDSTRAIVSGVNVVGSGGDTLVLSARRWARGEGAEYYVNDSYISGTYHIIVPRGTTYVTNSSFWCMSGTKICLFNEGISRETDKLVIRDSSIDGPEPFGLGSYFRDAAWYFVNDTISAKLRADGEIFRNPAKGYEMQWGEGRVYFGGNKAPMYPWLRDNLNTSRAKSGERVTSEWTLPDWNPESRQRPTVVRIERIDDELRITFSESVTVQGAPIVRLGSGATVVYAGGSGSKTLVFGGGEKGRPVRLDLNGGAIFASGASRWQRDADCALPR